MDSVRDRQSCEVCGTEARKLWAGCSADCQREDWSEHKPSAGGRYCRTTRTNRYAEIIAAVKLLPYCASGLLH